MDNNQIKEKVIYSNTFEMKEIIVAKTMKITPGVKV